MRCASLLVVVLLAGAPRCVPALAAGLALREITSPATYAPPGRAIDILGITPGMPPPAVSAILAKRYGEVRTYQDRLGLNYRGITVFTEPYTTRITAEQGGERVTVLFGTPTTRNGVVEVSIQTDYFGAANAPELGQLLAEFMGKYGPPADQPASPTPNTTTILWSYSGNKPTQCPRSSCGADFSEGLDASNLGAYQRAAQAGHGLIIVASLLSSTRNPDRAGSVVVRVSDTATKAGTLEAAIAQMKEAAAGGHPGDGPRGDARRP